MTDVEQPAQSQPEKPTHYAGATRAQVKEWQNEHGEDRVKLLSVPVGQGRQQFIIRAPSRTEYNQYLSNIAKSDRSFDRVNLATRNLFSTCLLAPDVDIIKAIWEQYPALTDKMTEPLMTLAGTDLEVREETF